MIAKLKDRPILAALALIATGALLEACGGNGPRQVAERFWEAAADRDIATVEALSLPSDDTEFNFDDEGTDIRSLEIGEASADGDRAEVETRFEVDADEMTLDVEFMTVMARSDGEWLVDLDRTTSEIMKAVIGASIEELGEAIGEGMKGAMEGMAEGMAEGMQELAEGMNDMAESLENAAEEREKRRR